MTQRNKTYIAIDLKSFYASVECVERGLDALDTNLVVADSSRTDKTICLAVSPSLKSYGIPGRARLFEVVQHVKEINRQRRLQTPNGRFSGQSYFNSELKSHKEKELSYIVAVPRMSYYIEYSTRIYQIYLKYIAPEDIHVYSIDEVFIDATSYLENYKLSARELTMKMIREVLKETGVTATAGIGTNLYLCKIAMDIVAKHIEPDADGVRIAELDEMSYRRKLWNHQPLTDFWRVGGGIAQKLALFGIDTMGKLARCSIENEELLYRLFGVNAELLIDHAWGWEPCTIDLIKSYKPSAKSFSSGQVLHCPYDFRKARTVVLEMADAVALDLVDKRLLTDQLVLSIGYDISSSTQDTASEEQMVRDHYGRLVRRPSHGSVNLPFPTSSSKIIMEAVRDLYEKIVDPNLMIRRINLTTNHIIGESNVTAVKQPVQLDLFVDYQEEEKKRKETANSLKRERKVQEALLSIKKRYGKNSILKGLNFEDGATAKDRNNQIGGHKM